MGWRVMHNCDLFEGFLRRTVDLELEDIRTRWADGMCVRYWSAPMRMAVCSYLHWGAMGLSIVVIRSNQMEDGMQRAGNRWAELACA